MMSASLNGPVGVPVPHESARAHVTGRARYVDDLDVPADALHIATGYIDCGRASITEVDLTAVRSAPGVVDVVTAADVPGQLDIGAVFPGDPLLAAEEVSFSRQPIFAVAATSLRLAQQAVRLAQIEAEDLEGVYTLDEADAQETEVLPSRVWGVTDVSVEGPHKITGRYQIGGQEHFYLEGQAALAAPLDDGGVFVVSSTQHPDEVQHAVADVLGIPLTMVVVECQRMGGAFGGKESQAASLACMAALFAYRTGRTVRYRMPRHDDMHQTGKRHEFQWRYEISCTEQGELLQGDIDLVANCGHSPDLSAGIVERAMFHATNAYAFESVRVRGHYRRLNQVSHTAFRGFGGPQGMLGIEAALDDIAYQLELDPFDVRLKNLYREGANQTYYGQNVEGFWLREMMLSLAKDCDYQARRAAVQAFNDSHQHLKKGIALTPVQFGISFTTKHLNQAGALVHLYRDGSLQLNHGGTEMGQGLHTKMKQIAADVFGIPLAQVRHTATRTDKVPNASPTAASSGSDMNGMAVLAACATLKSRLEDFLKTHFDVDTEVVFAEGRVTAGDRVFDFVELVNAAYLERVSLSATGYYATPGLGIDKERGWGNPFLYFAYGVSASEVVIDTRTGEYRVLRADILHDVGASLNEAIDIGQIEGGFVQGLGWLTCEELVFDDQGRLASNGPANYKIPTADMCPPDFRIALFRRPNPVSTIYRSKAVGEPPLMLPISAWCALRQACAANGHKLPRLPVPATPEAVYWAAQEAAR